MVIADDLQRLLLAVRPFFVVVWTAALFLFLFLFFPHISPLSYLCKVYKEHGYLWHFTLEEQMDYGPSIVAKFAHHERRVLEELGQRVSKEALFRFPFFSFHFPFQVYGCVFYTIYFIVTISMLFFHILFPRVFVSFFHLALSCIHFS